MTQFEKDVYDRFDDLKNALSTLEKTVVTLKDHLDADYSALHGNGKPGLLAEHQDLEKRVHTLELKDESNRGFTAWILNFIAWVVTTVVAVYAAIKN